MHVKFVDVDGHIVMQVHDEIIIEVRYKMNRNTWQNVETWLGATRGNRKDLFRRALSSVILHVDSF